MRVRDRILNACGITAGQRGLNKTSLRRRQVSERLRHRQERIANGDAGGRPAYDVAGKEARFLSSSLFKREEEESPIFFDWSANRGAILAAGERRLLVRIVVNQRSKGVARLNTFVTDESKEVAVEIVCSPFRHDVHDPARGAPKLRRVGIRGHLIFLHCLLRNAGARGVDRVVREIRAIYTDLRRASALAADV